MNDQNQNIKLSSKPSSALQLRESNETQKEIESLLFACATTQKLYGRDPNSFEAMIKIIMSVLSDFPAQKSALSVKTWLMRNSEFPTVSDLVNLIQRNGKPPLKESDIIAIRKKDGADRTRADWQMLEEWDAQQLTGWGSDYADSEKQKFTTEENIRLRKKIKILQAENAKLADLLRNQSSNPAEIPLSDKVQRTVDAMRKGGAPQADIDEFLSEYSNGGPVAKTA